jgi:glyoxylate reductase
MGRHSVGTVAVTSALPGDALLRLAKFHGVRVHPGGSPLGGRELVEFAAGADALIALLADNVDASVFAGCPRLKIVANVAVGFNNIDAEAARAAGVWVTNTPDVLTEATADLTWALILAVTRRLVEGDRVLRGGGFLGWKPDFMLGAGLQERRLGIVGMGRIGRAVARRAVGFAVSVCYHDREPVPAEEASGAEFVPILDEILPRVDILSLHCPLNEATRHLLDARRLHLLPKGSFVINTSRGEVIDEAALA